MPLRQGQVDVCREALSADELIERGIRGVYDVAQVERAALLAVAGLEGERREESTARFSWASPRLLRIASATTPPSGSAGA